MRRGGYGWVVAVLAAGCLEAPPSSSASGDAGETPDIDAGSEKAFVFPPGGAEVRISAAFAADIDGNGREDLVLLDDETDDDWTGVYILRAGAVGWVALDEVMTDFQPTTGWFGRLLRPGGPALVLGGANGKLAVVDYKPDAPYEVEQFDFGDTVSGPLTMIHSGIATAGDTTASLVFSNGSTLWSTSPMVEGGPLELEELSATTDSFLAASFWPLRVTDPAPFIAARQSDQLEWFADVGGGDLAAADAITARFVEMVDGMCGTHIVVGIDNDLRVGWIECDGSSAANDPLEGSLITQVTAVAAGHIAGSAKHDVVLLGIEAGQVSGQVLIDIDSSGTAFVPDTATALLELQGVVPATVFLTPVDAEADGTALVYAVAPSGAMYCGRVEEAGTIEPCPLRWQVTRQ